jgi:hypothetical protein
MKRPKLTPEQQKKSDEITRKFKRNLMMRPVVSDKDFMAETEVSDADYKRGMTLPGTK